MKKLRHPRWLVLSTLAAAMALISAVPAGAVGEEPGSLATLAGEGAIESTEGTEPLPPAEAPAAPGWVPQDDAAEEAGGAAAPAQRGSSLGSGGSASEPRAPAEQPEPSEQPAPVPAASGTYESEVPSSTDFEEATAAPEGAPAVEPEPQPAEPVARLTPVALGAADAVAASGRGSTRSAIAVKGVTAAGPGEQAGAGSDSLPWPALIVFLLIFLYAGARLLLGPVELDIFRSSPFRRVRRGYPRA